MSLPVKRDVEKITRLILNLSRRPRDYEQDATLRSDICSDHMIEYLDRRWSGKWWYRYFVKNKIGELRRVVFDLAQIASNYSRSVSDEEIALLTAAVSDVERIDKLNALFQTHRLVSLGTGEFMLSDRTTNRTASRAFNLRQLADNYTPAPELETVAGERPVVLELDPHH